ncbi:DUF2963 domain-containing protein, partial [Paulownia witches'-broom phytoplasma]|uniref:DUF2963 domain-containing protein n=1 Tax=Paulownia witches'-broom phytoplasma TaxID=39647 RepID=UPI0030DCB32A
SIIKQIEAEVDKLTTEEEIVYHPDGKTIDYIKIFDSETKKVIKIISYDDDGKIITSLKELNPEGKQSKLTFYNSEGKIIERNNYNSEGKRIEKTNYNSEGKIIQRIYYNPD